MPDKKTDRLRQSGTLNSRPEAVSDPLFQGSEFFDPRDLLLVRYEMVRTAAAGAAIEEAAVRFGTSVPTCVRANRAFRENGLQGLIPKRRGPRGPHKITAEIVAFVEEYRREHGPVGLAMLVPLIAETFGVKVHASGLYRALAKKTQRTRHDRES